MTTTTTTTATTATTATAATGSTGAKLIVGTRFTGEKYWDEATGWEETWEYYNEVTGEPIPDHIAEAHGM